MAGIRSTMDMVMERAAKMASSSAAVPASEEIVKQGMRLAAAFMRNELADLATELDAHPAADQPALRQGMAETLLRNLGLPREDEQLQSADLAIRGLLAIGGNDQQLQVIFQELQPLLKGYREHKKQLRGQLEESFAQQAAAMEAQLAKQTGVSMKVPPARHPRFVEEWERLRAELDSKYGQVLEHHKSLVRQRFS